MSKRSKFSMVQEDEHWTSTKRQNLNYDSVLQINDSRRFDRQFPFFRQPSEVGCFSVDINRKFLDNKSQLKYLIQPKNRHVCFDLRKGYKDMIRKPEDKKEYIDFILKWILQHMDKFVLKDGGENGEEQLGQSKRNLHTDFVCWRGLLTKLLCTPYENREGWLIAVTLFNGSYYLCEFDTEGKKHREENKTEREDEMCCWGWKFEQYLSADTPNSTPETETAFNNCENYCTVVRSRLNEHSLVFSGEVDAISTDKSSHYVEMKTTREITHPRQAVSLKRFKYIKWWAQSFLVGIPEIVCGYRTDDGIVTSLENLNTQKIPEMVKDLHNPWKPNVCFNFLDDFLSFVKRSVKTDDPKTVHLFSWEPSHAIKCRRLEPGSDFVFLPDWYTGVT